MTQIGMRVYTNKGYSFCIALSDRPADGSRKIYVDPGLKYVLAHDDPDVIKRFERCGSADKAILDKAVEEVGSIETSEHPNLDKMLGENPSITDKFDSGLLVFSGSYPTMKVVDTQEIDPLDGWPRIAIGKGQSNAYKVLADQENPEYPLEDKDIVGHRYVSVNVALERGMKALLAAQHNTGESGFDVVVFGEDYLTDMDEHLEQAYQNSLTSLLNYLGSCYPDQSLTREIVEDISQKSQLEFIALAAKAVNAKGEVNTKSNLMRSLN